MEINIDDIKRIKSGADRIHNYYNLALQKRGDYAVGLCPFHSEKTPSFNVRISGDKEGQWICYSCGVKGPDILSFVADMEGLDRRRDFPKVVKKAADILNFPIGAISGVSKFTHNSPNSPNYPITPKKLPPIYVQPSDISEMQRNPSTLYNFIEDHFNPDDVCDVFGRYRVGGYFDRWSAFPFINAEGNCVDVHLQAYDEAGHRWKENGQNWYLNIRRLKDRRGEWCLFGEHLINGDPSAPIGIVESEKTALIAALYMPQYIWMATGGLARLNPRYCAAVRDRECYLFPDADGVGAWREKAEKMKAEGFKKLFIAADFMRRYAEQPKDDLADIILRNIDNERK